MIEFYAGAVSLFELTLTDGATGKFPQVEIYDSAGAAIGISPVSLSHVSGGLYQGTGAAPAVGPYSCLYIVYDDAAHTIISGNYERASDHLRVIDPVGDAVWTESLPAAFAAGTAGNIVGVNLDATISSRSSHTAADVDNAITVSHGAGAYVTAAGFAVPGSAMTLTAGERTAIDGQLSGAHGAGAWEGDAITAQEVRDAMKLAPTAGAPAAGSVDTHLDTIEADTSVVEPLVSTNLDATISSRGTADPGDAMTLTGPAASGLVGDVWDELIAGHLAVGSVGESLNDAASGAGVDWTVSERSQMRKALGITGATLATAAGELQDTLADTAAMQPLIDAAISTRSTLAQTDILSDSVPFPGADIDASISSRSSHTAADVDSLVTISHGAGSYQSAAGFAVAGDQMALTPAAAASLVDDAWNEAISSHLLAGSTGKALDDASAGGVALTQQNVRDAMKLSPSVGAPAAGSVDTHLDAIELDSSVMEPLISANVDTTISSRGTADPGDAMTLTGPAVSGAVDAVWDELIAGHIAAGTTGEALDNAGGGATPGTIAAAVWAESLPGAFGAGEAGNTLGVNLDATVSSRSSHTPADVDTALSGTHGAGSWESDSDTDWTAGEKEEIRGALGVTGVQSVPGGGGQLQDVLTDTAVIEPLAVANLDAPISTRAIPGDAMAITAGAVDDIWDEVITAHIAPGTAGQALTMALGNSGGQVRDDALTWDANDRPLTLRRRIFPDAATAGASTPGGTGEGELLTVTIGASHIDAARWQSLLRTV